MLLTGDHITSSSSVTNDERNIYNISLIFRGSMDAALSKMLHLHLPSRHPKGYPDLEIAPIVQCASLMGLGMLFESSNQRCAVELLIVIFRLDRTFERFRRDAEQS